jgi:HAE1 family hydrophobic/amphiphilic exporter-1
MLHAYDASLQWVLRYRPLTMAIFVVVLVATAVLFVIIPKGFIPDQDTDQIAVTTEGVQGASFDEMATLQHQVAGIINADPDVDSLVSTVGGAASSSLGGQNFGQIVVHLRPRADRDVLVATSSRA